MVRGMLEVRRFTVCGQVYGPERVRKPIPLRDGK